MSRKDVEMPERTIPAIGSQWKWGEKRFYTVILIANEHFDTSAYPTTIIYQGFNGRIWAKNLTNFCATMRKVKK